MLVSTPQDSEQGHYILDVDYLVIGYGHLGVILSLRLVLFLLHFGILLYAIGMGRAGQIAFVPFFTVKARDLMVHVVHFKA